MLGGTAYTVSEKQQRSSFQETKRSLRDKLTIEQQSKEQVSLVLIKMLTVVYNFFYTCAYRKTFLKPTFLININ